MRKYKLLIIVFLACLNIPAWAQDVESGITGVVVDKWDHPIYGASIQIAGQPESRVETDRDGNFEIAFIDETVNLEVFATERGTVKAVANPGQPVKVVMGFAGETIDVGADITFTREQSTASVSTAYTSEFGNRNAKNISNTLYGQGLGLVTLQNGGYYAETNPTFYVRGLQGQNNNTPLVLVDGIERDMNLVSADEVESISVLKDAAAVALYGYRGSNGAILITTKRGKYNAKEINISYDHEINYNVRRPKFVDAATYASAVNEARSITGLAAQYSDNEIAAYRSGEYPYAYPDVDWINETFRKHGITNKYLVEFRGGGKNFRYYTMLDMVNDAGYVKNPHLDSTYSTQDKYSRANLRANLDMDLTSSTKMKVNLMGSLTETLRPGDSVNLWELIYETPANAFPAYADDSHLVWGGNTTGNFLGTANPVAQSQGAGYVKAHSRVFFADMTLSQDLSALTKGLSVNARLGYDNYSNITENHSKTYTYAGYTSTWTSGSAPTVSATTGGEATELGTSASTDAWTRRFNFMLSFDYARTFGGKHDVYGQLKYEYNFNDSYGINTSVYHRDYSFFGHYGYDNRYIADFVLMGSQSSLLAPDHKWALSPTLSVAWVISNEKFLKNNNYVNFLKFRASAGVISSDNLPDGTTAYNYWDETYGATGSGYYLFGASDGDVSWGNYGLTRFALINPSHERTYKYNAGFDATFFHGLDVTVEGYFNHRTHEWLDSSGKYTAVIGLNAPYENAGVVNSYGVEVGLDYTHKFGPVVVNLGGNYSFSRNKIKEMLEEPRLYDNLVQTGHRVNQVYGMQSLGFFADQNEIDASPTQEFSTLYPGDIKYADVNGDGTVNSDDTKAIGYSTAIPEMYYSFHIGAEWNGLGVNALFQGTANYSAVLSKTGMFRPALDSSNLSQYYYDNRWTADGSVANPLFPRLVTESNSNNYRTSTTWLVDRSFLKLRNLEVYYKLPQEWLRRSKVVDNAKIYVRGIDLFCWDHLKVLDPENYDTYTPLNKSVVVGVNIGF